MSAAPPREREAAPSQVRHWRFQRACPGSAAMSMPMGLLVSGPCDGDRLAGALEAVLARHDALHGCFREEEGGRLVHVVGGPPAPPRRVDLRDLPAGERVARLRALGARDAQEPFDLERGPLVRAAVVRCADDEHAVLVNVHHVAFDGWSVTVLLDELVAAYEGRPLPELPLRYDDHAARQREELAAPDAVEPALAYWRRQLDARPERTEWPAARPRPAGTCPPGDVVWRALAPATAAAVERAARELRATPFMVLLAAFYAAVQRASGQEDLVVGVPYAARLRRDVEGLLGFFVNTLVLRARVTDQTTFAELVGQVRSVALAGSARQAVPYALVLDDLGGGPLFQLMFVLQDEVAVPPRLGEAELRQTMLGTRAAKYDMTWSVERREGTLTLDVEFHAGLFEAEEVEAALDGYAGLLDAVLGAPRTPIGALEPVALAPAAPSSPGPGAALHEQLVALFRPPLSDWAAG